jgi:hypothetical protein
MKMGDPLVLEKGRLVKTLSGTVRRSEIREDLQEAGLWIEEDLPCSQ